MKYINENGRSMVEMLGVLAIIGVLSVGGIAGYSKAMNKYKINKTTDQVSMLVANIRTLFSSQGDYAGLTNAQAIKFGVVPNDMYKATSASQGDISNAFGGAVTITAAAGRAAGDNEAFIVEYAGLSSEACVTVATGDWGSGQSSGLIGIAAGNASDVASGTLSAVGTALNAVLTTNTDAPTASQTVAISIPGASTPANTTPMTVTRAVSACNASGSTGVVAWKYY